MNRSISVTLIRHEATLRMAGPRLRGQSDMVSYPDGAARVAHWRPWLCVPSPAGVRIPKHLGADILSHFPRARTQESLALDLGCGDGLHREICEHAGAFAGFRIETIAPSKSWSILSAPATLALFPGLPKAVCKALMLPVTLLHGAWWRLQRLTSGEERWSDQQRMLAVTGAFTFIARKA